MVKRATLKPQTHPEWFTRGDRILGPILLNLHEVLRSLPEPDLNIKTACEAAGLHFVQCLNTSIEVNKGGLHAIAVSLVRQCLEALSVVDAGLQPRELRHELIQAWLDEQASAGGIRKRLQAAAWFRYGDGLWGEGWPDLMSEFTAAVHPYAHYTQLLQGWQFAHLHDQLMAQPDGSYHAYMSIGHGTYDATKATRITLLHMILAWIAGRILLANGHAKAHEREIHSLGRALAAAEWLGGGKAPWHQEFWPHMFDKPRP